LEARSTAACAPSSMSACSEATLAPESCSSTSPVPRRTCGPRKARASLSFPPSYTLRMIESATLGASLGARERAVQEVAAHPHQRALRGLARRLHQLAIGAGQVAVDVVLAESKDGALAGRRALRLGGLSRGRSHRAPCAETDRSYEHRHQQAAQEALVPGLAR